MVILWCWNEDGIFNILWRHVLNDQKINLTMSCLRSMKYLSRPSMGVNTVSVSVILREKLQFMYTFKIFVAFIQLFRTTKTLKAVHWQKWKIAYAVRILWTASKISSLLPIFVSVKYIMLLVFHAYILKLLFKVILVVLWLWSLYALYCLVNVKKKSNSFDKQQTFNDFQRRTWLI